MAQRSENLRDVPLAEVKAMAAQAQKAEVDDHALTLEDRRAFMKLPLEERHRRLAEQAERMVDHYNLESETAEREIWQGGDIVEPE